VFTPRSVELHKDILLVVEDNICERRGSEMIDTDCSVGALTIEGGSSEDNKVGESILGGGGLGLESGFDLTGEDSLHMAGNCQGHL
jgi:hypothetical protein